MYTSNYTALKALLLLLIIGGGFSGYSQDSIEYDGKYVNRVINGKREGHWIIFAHTKNLPDYSPNAKYEEGKFMAGRRTGRWTRFHANGEKWSEVEYKRGRKRGSYTTYYDNGQVQEVGTWIRQKNVGEFRRYYQNGTIQQEKVFTEMGKTNGPVKYYYDNGQIELEFTTKNGVEFGTATRYYKNGNVKNVMSFDAAGKVTEFKEMKRVDPPTEPVKKRTKLEAPMVTEELMTNSGQKGKEIGEGFHILYNANQDISMKGNFANGRLVDGEHYIYDQDGLLEKIDIYKAGKFAGNGVMDK